MPNKPIALEVKAAPSKQQHALDLNKTGQWTLVPNSLQVEKAERTFDGDDAALFNARAQFEYQGGSRGTGAPGDPIVNIDKMIQPNPSTIRLEPPQATLLKEDGKSVLVEGDWKRDTHKNVVRVSRVSQHFHTANEQ